MVATRAVLFLFGIAALLIGVAGVLLPVIPGTPFLLLAAAAFNRSSPRFHAWLLGLPGIGDAIREWERTGSIDRRVKWWVTLVLGVSIAFTLSLTYVPVWARASAGVTVAGVLAFIWTRPDE
ncbi:MAG: YbaN family protein [Planctomycetota bacterium]|jgi:uncharacterized membrane protein YbaN (DUF454 family)